MDLSLYLVLDPAQCLGRDPVWVAARAVAGGVTIVQLRDKHADDAEYLETAQRLAKELAKTGTPLILNDRVHLVNEVGAQGVHVGQSDMPVAEVRKLLGSEVIVGLSLDTDEQAAEARNLPVDYLGVGPINPTNTKADHSPVIGMNGFARRMKLSGKPCVGIGSVNAENSAEVMAAGACGVAVVSAICRADDPEGASREIREAMKKC